MSVVSPLTPWPFCLRLSACQGPCSLVGASRTNLPGDRDSPFLSATYPFILVAFHSPCPRYPDTVSQPPPAKDSISASACTVNRSMCRTLQVPMLAAMAPPWPAKVRKTKSTYLGPSPLWGDLWTVG
jgi:hypothetical protein